jgi:hypothetical protein
MFGFGKKESYEDRIRAALAENRQSKAASIAREAFANDKEEEHVLAWVASSVYEREISSAFDLLEEFMVRFPNSLHLPRVYLADILSRASRFDQASDLSRYYLRLAHESGVLPELASKRIIQEGVSRSFLLLTSAYTTLGARSYSRRVLQFGLGFGLAERWRGVIENELHQLGNELQQAEFADEDSKWECFFGTGAGLDGLYKKCIDGGFPLMARRIDLLEGNFRFNASFVVDTSETLLLAVEVEDNGFMLR